MSVLTSTETLLSPAFTPLVTPLEPYHRVFWDVVPEPDFGLTSRTPMLNLPAVTLATLHLKAAPAQAWMPDTRGIVTEASIRLAIWKDRGLNLSAYEMALNLQYVFFRGTGDRRDGRVPLLGLDLLRCIDELSCEATELWCSVPKIDVPYELEDVRLKTAIARFEHSLSTSQNDLTKGDQRRRRPIE